MCSEETLTENEILALFDSYADQKSSLMMTKSYRGLLFSQEVKTVAVDAHRAVFQALDLDCCAALEGCVHLHSSFLPKPVKARVRDLSVRRGMFSLSDFSYIPGDWRERFHERVQPKDPTYISLCHRREYFRASLLDISFSGMGVLICSSDDCEFEFEPNSSVCIDFQITPALRWTKLGGAIHYQQKLSKTISRLGIRLYAKLEQARQLEKYLADRKAEILEELEQSYDAALMHSGVEYQYF
jgi:hypothetical protein